MKKPPVEELSLIVCPKCGAKGCFEAAWKRFECLRADEGKCPACGFQIKVPEEGNKTLIGSSPFGLEPTEEEKKDWFEARRRKLAAEAERGGAGNAVLEAKADTTEVPA